MKLAPQQRAAWNEEMRAADAARRAGDFAGAFRRFERAHVIGQRNVLAHTRAHIGMLRIGFHMRDPREIVGQLLRIPAALTKTLIWVPRGNTGGANVSAFRPMPVPADLQAVVE